jgi:selenide,water dikinase
MPALKGFERHGVPAKPLGHFAHAWAQFCRGEGAAQVVVLGGGIAGVELAMAMAHGLRKAGRSPEVTIVDQAQALSALGERAQILLRRQLAAQGIGVKERARAMEIHADKVVFEGGETLPAGFVTGAAGAYPYPWLKDSGLTDASGFIPVDPQLRSLDPKIFAVGDCAEMVHAPRPKAGVYAVRQAPILFHNLRAALSGTGGMKRYRPQKDYLKLVSLGEKSALVERFGLAFAGPALWRWKDRIDRDFMDKFMHLPTPRQPALPWPRAAGSKDAQGGKPVCGGCGSKLGAATLTQALGVAHPGDDAAVLSTGNTRQVISTDHLRGFVADPVAMTRIAAVHALGDIWAMGATPQAALASIILPRQSPELAARQLAEIMETARNVLQAAGAEVIGGHSTMGAELTIGFTVTGLCERVPIQLGGARPGDTLILTKPIGSGVIMAAHMQARAPGEVVAAALREMMRPQADAAEILAGAHAMTDVTGFGLAGHLRNICAASRVGARVEIENMPLLHGALALSEAGVRSTLYPENREGFEHVPDDPRRALLFDPQTGGGLLAAVPKDADALCADLRAKGFVAAVIGKITEQEGQISFV